MSNVRRADLVTCTVDGEVVILDRTAGYVHQLNATASQIWSACDGKQGADEIAERIASCFDDPPPTVLQDVLRTLNDLQRLGLLVDIECRSAQGDRSTQSRDHE
jgi:hypothetical protein